MQKTANHYVWKLNGETFKGERDQVKIRVKCPVKGCKRRFLGRIYFDGSGINIQNLTNHVLTEHHVVDRTPLVEKMIHDYFWSHYKGEPACKQ